MHFGMKNTLKINRNHTSKQTLKICCLTTLLFCFFKNKIMNESIFKLVYIVIEVKLIF
jgi:hypothetical protein